MSGAKPKVLLAMSGGVDSSVAAALLLQQGYDVVGCFLRLGSPGEDLEGLVAGDDACDPRKIKIGHQGCCSVGDAQDARLVAATLSIPFYVCNFKREFSRIIDYFTHEYNAGRTPNPCVRCNDWLKFGKLHDYATQIGADFVASGHYARIGRGSDGEPILRRGVDGDKDQSYVLFGAQPDRLRRTLLPIGEYRKQEIRDLAARLDLPVFDKPDSQEICFVPDNDYAGLLRRRTPESFTKGVILDPQGQRVGEHAGHQHFTIGQRRGVGVALGYPIYVVDKNPVENTITVGTRKQLASVGLTARESNWLLPPQVSADDASDLGDWRRCHAQIRYNASAVPGRVRILDEDSFEVRFDEQQLAVAPGQAVVCYDAEQNDVVLGGGWIDRALRPRRDV